MKSNKFLRFLLSLILAFCLWLYVISVEVPEGEFTFTNIQVSFQNETVMTEERNLMITTDEIPTITLTLKGNRTELNKLNNSNISVVVDLSQVYEPGQQRLTYKPYFPPEVSNNAFEVVGSTPNTITLEVEKRVSKEVPVVVNYTGKLPEDYTADTASHELSSKVVNIKGPESVVNEITQARIDIDLTDQVETIVAACQYTLCNEAGEAVDAKQVVTDVGEIDLKLKIQRIKEVPLELTINDGGGATKSTSKIVIDPLTIKVSGSETVLNELDVINIGTINLADYTEDTELTFPITIPDNVTNMTGITEAKVSLKFPDLAIKTFTITNITPVNVPEGYTVEMVTQALTVTIRGPKARVEDMTEADISAMVDVASAQAGSATFKAEIVMGEDYAAVGAIGNYSVSATLRAEGT